MNAGRRVALVVNLFLAAGCAGAVPAGRSDPGGAAPPASGAPVAPGFTQRLGSALPLDLLLRDEHGTPLRLRSLSRRAPLVIVLGYFHCPNLCGLIRSDLLSAFTRAHLEPRQDYELLAVSIDPLEGARDAAAAKAAELRRFGRPGAATGWHFLTGPRGELERLEQALGFTAERVPGTREYAHPAGVVFTSAEGIISGYLFGIGHSPTAVHAALEQARLAAVSAPAWPVRLLCYRAPGSGRYTLSVLRVLRLAALLTLVALALLWRSAARRPAGVP